MMMLIALYLAAIVGANLIVSALGPGWSPITAFRFLGRDLTTRDALHDRWRTHLWAKMAALIAAGSVLSAALSWQARQIALASFVAFCLSGLTDTLIYHILRAMPRLTRVNGSNIASALVDSVVFPTLAFSTFMPIVVLGQFIAKVAGGALWAWVLVRGKT